MTKKEGSETIPLERIESKIFVIRKQKVILDSDLAVLYGVETKVLVQAVKRNLDRFPDDFMFQVNDEEFECLRSQFVTSKKRGGRQYKPYAFTEQGIAMLSGVLKSKRAVQVNIGIMRAFVKLRQLLLSHESLNTKLNYIERKYDRQFRLVFNAISKLTADKKKDKRKIGFSSE